MVLYQTRAPRRFLATLTKFDLELTPSRLKNPNFDSAIRMSWTGWNQCHCEYYQIFNPTTIHGSKSELERPIYHENQVNALVDAPLSSDSHNFWSDCWIFKFHTFLETGSQDLFRGVKINPIWEASQVAALEGLLAALHGPPSCKVCQSYKRPQAPPRPKWRVSLGLALCLDVFYTFFLPLKHQKKKKKNTHTHTHTHTHNKVFWFFFLHQKYKVLLYPIFFSLILHLGFGV